MNSVLHILILSLGAYVGAHGQEIPKMLDTEELVKLLEMNTLPYLEMKAKRDQAADDVARQLFGSVASLDPVVRDSLKSVHKGVRTLHTLKKDLEAVCESVDDKLKKALGLMSGLKAECPTNIGFSEESMEEPEHQTIHDADQEDEEEDDSVETEPAGVVEENFITTGADDRIAMVIAELGEDMHIKLSDALALYSKSAQMCDRYAAQRAVQYINLARKATVKLQAQIERLSHISAMTEDILKVTNSMEKSSAENLLADAASLHSKLSQLECQS